MRAGLVAMATALAIWPAGQPAWGHTFPAVRTVVVQVERCELVLLVGYRPAVGDQTQTMLQRGASGRLKDLMQATATAPISVILDGKRLVPTGVRTKLGIEPGGARPFSISLVTYALPAGNHLMITSSDPKATSTSWTDLDSHRVALADAPAQGKSFPGVAGFLLPLAAGDSPCANSRSSPSRSPRSP